MNHGKHGPQLKDVKCPCNGCPLWDECMQGLACMDFSNYVRDVRNRKPKPRIPNRRIYVRIYTEVDHDETLSGSGDVPANNGDDHEEAGLRWPV